MRYTFISHVVFTTLFFCMQIKAESLIPEDIEPISCVTGTFARSGSASWFNVSLTIRNTCGVNIDFTNTLITFKNAQQLVTNFWGSFSPLSYPDNSLNITSTPQSDGGFLASMRFHLPEASWSNRILRPSQSFTLFYGTSQPGYDASSVKVYVQNSPPPPTQDGVIRITTPLIPPALAGYSNAISVTLTRQDNGVSITRNLLWNGTVSINNLVSQQLYSLSSTTINYNGSTCTPRISPNTLVAQTNNSAVATIDYDCRTNTDEGHGKIMAYIPGWKTPPSAQSIAAAGYTHALVAFGVFSTTTPGAIVNAFSTITRDYIASLKQAGIKVFLSLGGASTSIPNTSVNFHEVRSLAASPGQFQSTFITSLQSLITQFGFDGVDIDIEHGLIGEGNFTAPTGDIATLATIINTLHQQNPSLLISLTPQVANISATSGFDGTWGNYASLIMQTASSLSYVSIQVYNTGCAFGIDHVCYADDPLSPDLSVAMAIALLEHWPQQDGSGRPTGFQPYTSFLNANQIALGYPAPNRNGASDGLPVKPTQVIKRAIKCLRTAQHAPDSCHNYVPPRAYPNFGAVFEWEITYDQDNSFRFATDLNACVRNGIC